MRLTVAVPCRDRLDQLTECLKSVYSALHVANACENGPDRVALLVIDDRSAEGFSGCVRASFPEVEVLPSRGIGPGAARNTALTHCDGDGILFTDSDCVVGKNWIAVACNWFRESRSPLAQGVPWLMQGRQNPQLASLEQKLYQDLFSSYVQGKACRQLDTRNVLVRANLVKARGSRLFPTGMHTAAAEARVLGDRLASLDVGIDWLPALRVYHRDPVDLAEVCRQKFRHGTGRRFLWREPLDTEILLERYFDSLLRLGLPADYVFPVHLAFLRGYYLAMTQNGERPLWWNRLLERLCEREDQATTWAADVASMLVDVEHAWTRTP